VLSAGLLGQQAHHVSQAGDIALTDLIVAEGSSFYRYGSIIGNSFICSEYRARRSRGDVTVAVARRAGIRRTAHVRIGRDCRGVARPPRTGGRSLVTGEAERLMELQGGTVSIGSARTLSGSETSKTQRHPHLCRRRRRG
jgi:hypothetical protein